MDNNDMIRMANQIAGFFNGAGPEVAAADTAEHISKFWEPRMRNALFAYIEKGGEGLDPTVIKAASGIKKPKSVLG